MQDGPLWVRIAQVPSGPECPSRDVQGLFQGACIHDARSMAALNTINDTLGQSKNVQAGCMIIICPLAAWLLAATLFRPVQEASERCSLLCMQLELG